MSKKPPDSPLDIVTALMQERLKFETWIATLERKRDATPANVYDRVHRDYDARLAAVLEELKTHAQELEAQAERFTARLAELAEREQERRDERAEAELRAHVGELSDDDWSATAKEADDALAAIAAEQAVVGADLNRVHELLGAATGSGEPAPPAPEPEPVPEPEAPAAPDAPPMVEAARETPEQSSFDELAFLKSVVSPLGSRTPVQQAKPTAPVKPAKPAASGPQISQDQSDALGEALVSRAGRPSQERAFIREDANSAASELVARAKEEGDRPFAANVTGNNPIVLRPSGAIEQPKTLKCGECGAMNYPTEWYCERCGAELASM